MRDGAAHALFRGGRRCFSLPAKKATDLSAGWRERRAPVVRRCIPARRIRAVYLRFPAFAVQQKEKRKTKKSKESHRVTEDFI